MSFPALPYTVGISRRFLPGFRKYRVYGHDTEQFGDILRLILDLVDGSVLAVPGIARRAVKVYPDYRQAELQRQVTAAKVERLRAPADDGVSDFDEILRRQQGPAAQ